MSLLSQSYTEDFSSGTKIIDTPGIYKLCSDITFGPNGPQPNEMPSETAFDPDLTFYAENEFGLGFFTALAIAADDVTLYLNGHTIEQSAGHALMQRFFAVIFGMPFFPHSSYFYLIWAPVLALFLQDLS